MTPSAASVDDSAPVALSRSISLAGARGALSTGLLILPVTLQSPSTIAQFSCVSIGMVISACGLIELTALNRPRWRCWGLVGLWLVAICGLSAAYFQAVYVSNFPRPGEGAEAVENALSAALFSLVPPWPMTHWVSALVGMSTAIVWSAYLRTRLPGRLSTRSMIGQIFVHLISVISLLLAGAEWLFAGIEGLPRETSLPFCFVALAWLVTLPATAFLLIVSRLADSMVSVFAPTVPVDRGP